MAIVPDNKEGIQFEPVSSGTHIARCVGVWDVGTHRDNMFGKDVRKVILMWEIPGERIEIERNGKIENLPRVVSRMYSNTLNEKSNLCHDLEAWAGKKINEKEKETFDLTRLLGKACMVQIIHETKGKSTYGNISTLMGLPKGSTCPPQETPSRSFDFSVDRDIPDETPKWIAKKIMESEEYKTRQGFSQVNNTPQSNVSDFYDVPPEHVEDNLPF